MFHAIRAKSESMTASFVEVANGAQHLSRSRPQQCLKPAGISPVTMNPQALLPNQEGRPTANHQLRPAAAANGSNHIAPRCPRLTVKNAVACQNDRY
jgi:hypothetical protein